MAKPIPKAKKSKSLTREIEERALELDTRSEKRDQYVQRILAANDDSIAKIVTSMVDNLKRMEGAPKLTYKGRTVTTIKGKDDLLKKIQERNFRYIAIRMLVACAKWDIRIGTFKLPKKFCADCGVKVK